MIDQEHRCVFAGSSCMFLRHHIFSFIKFKCFFERAQSKVLLLPESSKDRNGRLERQTSRGFSRPHCLDMELSARTQIDHNNTTVPRLGGIKSLHWCIHATIAMEDLNDIYFFASVVQHGGFSAAARVIGVEKTRLSRRIAALEKRLGVRLLQRTTRALALTEAGQRFFDRCVAMVEGAQAAYDSVAELRKEPAGVVRLSSPVFLAQRCLAYALPTYMAANPKVSVFLEPTDRTVNVIEERFDIAIRAKPMIEDAGLIAKTLRHSERVLVASPAFLERYGHPESPAELPKFSAAASSDDISEGGARWTLTSLDSRTQHVELKPRLVTSDLRVRLQAAIHGIGIALLPEQVVFAPLQEQIIERVLPEWSGAKNILHLVYPTPRGMLPSVRSLIDYLLIHVPAWLHENSI
jgi:DNA-binding transcriptional LysR family regulator